MILLRPMRPDELIDALGGSAAVADFLGVEINAVGNWRKRGFPAWALPKLGRMCRERNVNPGEALDAQPPRRTKAAA